MKPLSECSHLAMQEDEHPNIDKSAKEKPEIDRQLPDVLNEVQ
jgi:hypothetical protein